MSEALPKGWMASTLAEVVDPKRPITYGIVQPGPRQPEGTGVPIIRGQDYADGLVRTDSLYWVLPRIADSYRRSTVRPGDLLLSIVGYVGTVGRVPDELDGANLTQTTARLAIDQSVDPGFIFHQLCSDQFRGEVSRYTKGSAQPGLNLADVERMQLALPPLDEQRRIAEILDTIDATIQATEEVIHKLRKLEKAVVEEAFRELADTPGSTLRDSAAVLGGKRLPAGHSYSDRPTKYRYLRVVDFYGGPPDYEDLMSLHESTFSALRRYEIHEQELYISIAGSIGVVGVNQPPSLMRTILTENAARLDLSCPVPTRPALSTTERSTPPESGALLTRIDASAPQGDPVSSAQVPGWWSRADGSTRLRVRRVRRRCAR